MPLPMPRLSHSPTPVRLAAIALLAIAFASGAAHAAGEPRCRVVAGGGVAGPAPAGTDADFWNRLNFAFYDGAQYALSETGRPTENLFHVVGSPQAARVEEDAKARLAQAGCDEVIRVAVFGDDTASPIEIVFRITSTLQSASSSSSSSSTPRYQHEYRYPVNPDVEREVHPGALGAKAVADYLEAVGVK